MEELVALLSPLLYSAFFCEFCCLLNIKKKKKKKYSCIIHSHSNYWSPSKRNHFENMKAVAKKCWIQIWGISKLPKMKWKEWNTCFQEKKKKRNGGIANVGGSRTSTNVGGSRTSTRCPELIILDIHTLGLRVLKYLLGYCSVVSPCTI